MKYVSILLLFLSLNASAQQEKTIFLQTNPKEQYVISYSYGQYTFLFGYQNFLDFVSINEEESQSIRALIDPEIATKGFIDLDKSGKKYVINDEEVKLKQLVTNTFLSRMMNGGNFIVLNASGRMNISSLVKTTEVTPNDEMRYTYTNPDNGEVVLEYERRYKFTTIGCPSF